MALRFCFIFVFLWAGACGKQDPVERRGLSRFNLTEYERNSCIFQYGEGGDPLPNLGQHRFENTFFGKVYDAAQIEAVLAASSEKTVRYIQTHEVRVYSVRRPSRGCHHLMGIPEASTAVNDFWTALDDEADPVIGMFLPLYRMFELGSDQAGIIVRSDTDRWTIVREFMHFLFYSYRASSFNEKEFLIAWQRASTKFSETYKVIDEKLLESSSTYLKELAKDWMEFELLDVQHLKVGTLEKMLVEYLLVDEYRRGRFRFTTDYNRRRALVRVRAFYSSADSELSRHLHLAEKIQRAAVKLDLKELASSLDERIKEIHSLKAESHRVYQDSDAANL